MTDQLRSELGLIDLPDKDIYERYEDLRLWADRAMAENKRLREALDELVDLMDATYEGHYTPDSFTTQPAREVLQEGEE